MLKNVGFNNISVNLAEMKDLCLPNLLDNADFKSGIINQRCFESTTITGWSEKPTVDRWIFSGSGNATAEIDTDSMSISGDSGLIQTLRQEYHPGTYTVATNITELSGTLEISLVYSDDTSIDETVSGTGLFIHTFETTKSVKSVMFRCVGASSSFTFDSIKLEKGSVYTGMPQWDYVDELLNCQRFFYPLGGGWVGMFPARSDANTHSIYIQTPVIMRTIPTLIVKDGSDSSNALAYLNGNRNPLQATQVTCSSFAVSETNIFVVLTAPVGSTAQIGCGFAIFQKAMALDAETYKGGIIYGRF